MKMAIYKLVIRSMDPNEHKLHMVDYYCEADSRQQAREVFESNFGIGMHVVYGPVLNESNTPPDPTKLVTLKS